MEENRLTIFFLNHCKKLLYIAVFFALSLIFILRWSSNSHQKTSQDFINARQYAQQFQHGLPLDIASCQDLENIAERHHELYPLTEPVLKNSFLVQEKIDRAIALSLESAKRVQSFIPSAYLDYSNTSRLIFKKRYLEALQEAERLENYLANSDGNFKTLEAFNLLRILFLAKELDDTNKMHSTWEQLKTHQSYHKIQEIFSKGVCNLEQYLSQEICLDAKSIS